MSTENSTSYTREGSGCSEDTYSPTDTQLKDFLSSDIQKHFEIVEHIGKGAYGSVFEIKSKTDKKVYALKVVPLSSDQDIERMSREVEVLSQLQHPNIVRYHTSWNLKNEGNCTEIDPNFQCLCIQVEYCDQTLKDFIENMNSYDDQYEMDLERRRILGEILDGVKYIHEENIMHRDLNPKNIFLSKSGTVKIGDFGIARTVYLTDGNTTVSINDENLTSYFGTKLYCAPEVLNCSKSYDNRVDLYSLGLIIFEMWYPFQTQMERSKSFDDIKSSAIKIPDSFEPEIVKEILIGLLQHNSSDRMVLDDVVKKMLLIEKEDPFTEESLIQQTSQQLKLDIRKSVGRLIYGTDKKIVKGCCFRLGNGPYLITSYSVLKRRRFPRNWSVVFGRNEQTILRPQNPIWSNAELDVAILELDYTKSSKLFPEGLQLENQGINQKMFAFKNIDNQKSLLEVVNHPIVPDDPCEDIIIEFASAPANRGAPVLYVSDQNKVSLFGIVIGQRYRKGIKEKGKTIIRNITSVYESIDPIIPGDIRKEIFSSSPHFKCHERLMEKFENYIQMKNENDSTDSDSSHDDW